MRVHMLVFLHVNLRVYLYSYKGSFTLSVLQSLTKWDHLSCEAPLLVHNVGNRREGNKSERKKSGALNWSRQREADSSLTATITINFSNCYMVRIHYLINICFEV